MNELQQLLKHTDLLEKRFNKKMGGRCDTDRAKLQALVAGLLSRNFSVNFLKIAIYGLFCDEKCYAKGLTSLTFLFANDARVDEFYQKGDARLKQGGSYRQNWQRNLVERRQFNAAEERRCRESWR